MKSPGKSDSNINKSALSPKSQHKNSSSKTTAEQRSSTYSDDISYTLHDNINHLSYQVRIETIAGIHKSLMPPIRTSSTHSNSKNASLQAPTGICIDSNGNLYVSDRSEQTIKKIENTTHSVSLFSGVANTPGSNDGFMMTGLTCRLLFTIKRLPIVLTFRITLLESQR